MAIEFKLPELGEHIESAEVVRVLVSVGDRVEKDQPLLEVETDKASIEVPAPAGGTVTALHVHEGDTVRVGQPILTLEETVAEAAEPQEERKSTAPTPSLAPPEKQEPTPPPQTTPGRAIEFKLPELGEHIESAEVVRVLVSVGDRVEKDQPLLEVETDKASIEVPAPAGGTVTALHVHEGDTVRVGQPILTLEETVAEAGEKAEAEVETREAAKVMIREERQADREPIVEPAKPSAASAPSSRRAEVVEFTRRTPRPSVQVETARRVIPAAPSVRRLARELGIDIQDVPGTGPGGRISIQDVKNYARRLLGERKAEIPAPGPPLPDFSRWGEIERRPLSNIRRVTAENMSRAWTLIPHVTHHDKADITELERLRKQFAARAEAAGGKLTITAIILKVAAAALKAFPQFNTSLDVANNEIVYKKYYHIGVAVDTDRGLLVPVIRDVDKKNLIELAVELHHMAEKARARKLTVEEMQGGTFSITNLGGIGGTAFSPIVYHPQVAILGISRAQWEPTFIDGQFQPRLMLPLSLSYDHRVIDGADAARFLRWIAEALEQPFRLILEG